METMKHDVESPPNICKTYIFHILLGPPWPAAIFGPGLGCGPQSMEKHKQNANIHEHRQVLHFFFTSIR